MSEIKSIETLLLFRVCGQKVDAKKMMFGKEFSFGHEVDGDTEDTFDGSFATGGSSETTLSYTAKMSRKDKFSEEVEDATLDKVAYEGWIVDSQVVGENENANKYKARYFQGHFKKFEMKGEVGGINEYETEFKVYSRMQRGYATLPSDVKTVLDKMGYKFHDTVASDPATDGLAKIPQPVTQPVSNDSVGRNADSSTTG